jgi:hypothetical protein
MQRENAPLKLDQKMVKFGSKVRINTPLTPFSAQSVTFQSFTTSAKLSLFNELLPSPRTKQEIGNTKRMAVILALITVFGFIYQLWALIICRLIPKSSNPLIKWFQDDHFYCYLIPVLGPAYFFFMLVNWLGMKYFRHN